MIIHKMTATFGSLNKDSLELKPGLNIVQAPNEAGKSTWCAFLRVMLYGLKTQDRDKIGYLADKTRYRPWNGAAMEGAMDISHRGREMSLSRRARGAAPMKEFSARYTGTGEEVAWLNGENVGESLTGVSENVFTRSAFIRQAGLGVDRSAELEQRISALVSSGEEGVSYGDADARLREWQRKRYVNRANGRIAQLDQQIQALKADLERQGRSSGDLNQLRAKLDSFAREQALLEAELSVLRANANAAQARARQEQAGKIAGLEKQIAALETELNRAGRLLSKADAQQVRADCAAYQALQVDLAGRRAECRRLEELVNEKSAALQESGLADKSPEALRAAARADAAACAAARAVKAPGKAGLILAFVLLALLIPAALLFVFPAAPGMRLLPSLGIALAAAGLLGFALLLILRGAKKGKYNKAQAELAEILRRAGAAGPEELEFRAESRIREMETLEELKRQKAEAETALAAAEEETLALTTRLQAGLALFRTQGEDIPAALSHIDLWEEKIDRLAALRLSHGIESRLLAQMPREEAMELPAGTPQPRFSLEETERRLTLASEQLRVTEKALAAAEGEAHALGDPVSLGAELLRLEQSRAEQSLQYEALALAVAELDAANTELRTRFSPELSRRAGEIAAELTRGRYRGLYFDREWHAQARLDAEAAPRDSLYLSAGAGDQMYLALRLAICEMLLGGEEPCPIVLDDALTNFDDARMEKALLWLKQAAESRQVILMTCHSREAAFFREDPAVNIIRL